MFQSFRDAIRRPLEPDPIVVKTTPDAANEAPFVSKPFLAALVIALAGVLVYWGVWGYGFIWLDDPAYVPENPIVKSGLTWATFKLAWLPHASLWIPLTWISLMLDVSLFGMNPGPMHGVNLAFHLASGILLFSWLHEATGKFKRSLFVALLFTVHPLNVESVAWITERKNVLCIFFCLLSVWSHSRLARTGRKGYWAGTMLAGIGALLSKPTAVTLPFILLLVDAWPLGRVGKVSGWKLVLEKLPLFAMAGIVSFVAAKAPPAANIIGEAIAPLTTRLANAVTATAIYLGQLFWPFNLGIPYIHKFRVDWGPFLFATTLLAGITAFAWRGRKRAPWLLIGWFWYLGTLVPSSGIVQVGNQSHADRFTYLPMIGIYFALAWSFAEIQRVPRRILTVAASIAIAALAIRGNDQAKNWKDALTLAKHNVKVMPENWLALSDAGDVYVCAGKFGEGIGYLRESLRLFPGNGKCLGALGYALFQTGHREKAIECFEAALKADPRVWMALVWLATIRESEGKFDEAERILNQALYYYPGDSDIIYEIARIRLAKGDKAGAEKYMREALERNPYNQFCREALEQLLAQPR